MHTPKLILGLCCALLLSLAATSISFSQTALLQDEKNPIGYQSPNNGDIYVPAKTTLTLRLDPAVPVARISNNFSFTLRGEQSGVHPGTVIIADDNETIIFKPFAPFALNERV